MYRAVDRVVDAATAAAAATSEGRRRRGFRTAEDCERGFDVVSAGDSGGGGGDEGVACVEVAAISFRRAVTAGWGEGAAAAAARVCQTACEDSEERHLKRLLQPASGQANGVAPECNRA